MEKKLIKLTEQELHKIVEDSAKKILMNEYNLRLNKNLEGSLRQLMGTLNSFNCRSILGNELYSNLFGAVKQSLDALSNSYEYGPYEGEPYALSK